MPDAAAPEISNPRRILALSLDSEAHHLSRVLKDLTNSAPEPASTTLAGTSHDLPLKTPYYTATVPIWIDLISSPAEWAESFLSPEAKEVLGVLGGLVLIFSVPTSGDRTATREVISQVGRVVGEGLGGWEWDGVGLAVGVGEGETDEWDEVCAGVGLEFVHLIGKDQAGDARNEFGEKTGIPRVKEAFEANDWAQLLSDDLSDFGDFKDPSGDGKDSNDNDGKDFDPESLDFGFDKADFEGLRKAIWTSGVENSDGPEDSKLTDAAATASTKQERSEMEKQLQQRTQGVDELLKAREDAKEDLDDEDVEKVERMMRKLQAVREAGEGMSHEQRRRMAARAVEDVMREL